MAGYVKYGLSVAKGGEEGAEARKERAAAARASAMENFANFVNSMPKPESSWLEKAQAWIAGEGAPPEQTEPSQLDNLQSTVTKAVQDYQLSQEPIQQQINDEATELMKKKFAIPSLSGVVDSEKVKEIGRAHAELQSHHDLVCRLLLEKKKKSHQINKQKKQKRGTPHTAITTLPT